jgi:hypothetical protein
MASSPPRPPPVLRLPRCSRDRSCEGRGGAGRGACEAGRRPAASRRPCLRRHQAHHHPGGARLGLVWVSVLAARPGAASAAGAAGGQQAGSRQAAGPAALRLTCRCLSWRCISRLQATSRALSDSRLPARLAMLACALLSSPCASRPFEGGPPGELRAVQAPFRACSAAPAAVQPWPPPVPPTDMLEWRMRAAAAQDATCSLAAPHLASTCCCSTCTVGRMTRAVKLPGWPDTKRAAVRKRRAPAPAAC